MLAASHSAGRSCDGSFVWWGPNNGAKPCCVHISSTSNSIPSLVIYVVIYYDIIQCIINFISNRCTHAYHVRYNSAFDKFSACKVRRWGGNLNTLWGFKDDNLQPFRDYVNTISIIIYLKSLRAYTGHHKDDRTRPHVNWYSKRSLVDALGHRHNQVILSESRVTIVSMASFDQACLVRNMITAPVFSKQSPCLCRASLELVIM